MVRRECASDVCVCISYTGDEGQLGSSFLYNYEPVDTILIIHFLLKFNPFSVSVRLQFTL